MRRSTRAYLGSALLGGLLLAIPAPARAEEASAAGVTESPGAGAQSGAPPAEGVPETTVEYQLLASESDATRLCEVFIQQIMSGDYEAAFQGIRPHFPISERRFTKLAEETKKQHSLAQLQFGKPLGQVFVEAAMVKDSLLRVRFLEKFEWDAMYWEFLFYRPDRGWLLNGIGFDDDVQRLFRP